jgi:hypothetical protein
MDPIRWLNNYSVALQSIAALFSVVLTCATLYVLVVTWKAVVRQAAAAEAQAEASRALTDVAIDQTKAARDAAASAQTQSNLLSAQIELSAAPLLVSEPDDRAGHDDCKLVNRGQGAAFQITYWNGDMQLGLQGARVHHVRPSTLGPGNFAYFPYPADCKILTVSYKGVDREPRWTIVHLSPEKPQEHLIKKGLQQFRLS